MQIKYELKLKKDTGNRALLQLYINDQWAIQRLIDVPEDFDYSKSSWVLDTAGDDPLYQLSDEMDLAAINLLDMVMLGIEDAWKRCKAKK